MPDHTSLQTTGRPTVRVERRFPHPMEKVWRAVTTPEHLGAWFPSAVELDLRPGGAMRFPAFDGDAAATGTVEEVDAPRRLAFTWGGDRMTFELEPDGDGTRFVLSHTFDDTAGAASFATGWEICLAGLRSVLADDTPPATDRGIARHEELVHEFGLDRPAITAADGRWTVRYERQLTCPAEVAWDLWFGVDLTTGEQRTAPDIGEPLTPYMAPEVVLGTVTELERHRVLAFDVAPTGGPGDHVRVELGPGTGHGARLTLTVSGTDPAEREAALDQWGTGAVGHLAAKAAEWARAQPAPAQPAPS
jgi:uncharacterized protein YndB with AHSA1/START domain